MKSNLDNSPQPSKSNPVDSVRLWKRWFVKTNEDCDVALEQSLPVFDRHQRCFVHFSLNVTMTNVYQQCQSLLHVQCIVHYGQESNSSIRLTEIQIKDFNDEKVRNNK